MKHHVIYAKPFYMLRIFPQPWVQQNNPRVKKRASPTHWVPLQFKLVFKNNKTMLIIIKQNAPNHNLGSMDSLAFILWSFHLWRKEKRVNFQAANFPWGGGGLLGGIGLGLLFLIFSSINTKRLFLCVREYLMILMLIC